MRRRKQAERGGVRGENRKGGKETAERGIAGGGEQAERGGAGEVVKAERR